MKTLTQVVLPLTILAAVIGGVTFMANYTSTKSPGDSTDGRPLPADYRPRLYDDTPAFHRQTIPEVGQVVWRRDDALYEAECEQYGKHHRDFWFVNPHPVPIRISADYSSCNCS